MKRLLIAGFFIISTVTMLAFMQKNVKASECKQKVCCMKKCSKAKDENPKTDYIFWEPIGRLMIIPQ